MNDRFQNSCPVLPNYYYLKNNLFFSIFVALGFIWAGGFDENVYGQQPNDNNNPSTVNSICQIVQENQLIAGLTGLDQALNICNNINTIGSGQALTELCSIVGGLNIIDVGSFCNTSDPNFDKSNGNGSGGITDSGYTEKESQGSGFSEQPKSIVDQILSLIFGLFKMGN